MWIMEMVSGKGLALGQRINLLLAYGSIFREPTSK
jgi:hypothetical protein